MEFRKSSDFKGTDINNNNNNNNFMLDKSIIDKPCGAIKRGDGRSKRSCQPLCKSEPSRNKAVPSETTNQIEEKSPKSGQSFDYKQVSPGKSRSGQFGELLNDPCDPRSDESLKIRSDRKTDLDFFRPNRHPCLSDVWASASKVPEDSASCEDEESDGEVDVVDVGDHQAGSKIIEEKMIT